MSGTTEADKNHQDEKRCMAAGLAATGGTILAGAFTIAAIITTFAWGIANHSEITAGVFWGTLFGLIAGTMSTVIFIIAALAAWYTIGNRVTQRCRDIRGVTAPGRPASPGTSKFITGTGAGLLAGTISIMVFLANSPGMDAGSTTAISGAILGAVTGAGLGVSIGIHLIMNEDY